MKSSHFRIVRGQISPLEVSMGRNRKDGVVLVARNTFRTIHAWI